MVDQLDQKELEERGSPAEQLTSFPLKKEDSSKVVQIEALLPDEERS